ncbi:MAG TPA: hypothetical protein VMZ50_14200 [Phycisphaerae bacterium]|nr:hypothetical protein [Phycisphaerae bacterium]
MSEGSGRPAADLLAPFRAQEQSRPELVHPLVQDPVLCNLVVAWSTMSVAFAVPEGEPPAEESARWDWLWTGTRWDRDDLGNALRVSDKLKLGQLVERAKRFRLIYPDGRANDMALQYIRGAISRSLTKGGKR